MSTRTPVDINALVQFVGHIGAADNDLISRGSHLFHYTDLNALASIVQKHDLWLTNARFSNDAQELEFGRKAVLRVLERLIEQDHARSAYLSAVRKAFVDAGDEDAYICCFCEEDNRLSQWRGYGANGAGVAIQMEITGFSMIAGADCPLGVMRLWKVFYDPDDQERRVGEVVDYWHGQGEHDHSIRAAADCLRFFVPTFKHPDFREEGEWRLIFTPSPGWGVEPEFRVSRGMLVPYYSLQHVAAMSGQQMRTLPIQQVRIGPGSHRELNAQSVEMLLRRDYPNVPVKASPTPYRG